MPMVSKLGVKATTSVPIVIITMEIINDALRPCRSA
jgi:hypothetical protein